MATEFSNIINQFSKDIFKNSITDKKNENIILSPLSIQTALSLVYLGANGKTAEEMSSVMKYEKLSRDEITNHFQTFMTASNNNSLIQIANKIYVRDGYKIKDEFNEIAKNKFLSETQNIDFVQQQKSANEINQWVEEKTNDKIKNLVLPDDLDDDTRIILVNAIYFKGTWIHKFDKDATKSSKFWMNESKSIHVPIMKVRANFKYAAFEELDAVGLEMPYKDSDISMFVILPNKIDGLKKLEGNLTQIDYLTLTEKMFYEEVDVSFPKFKIEFEIKLKEVLKKMGMETMFTGGADFSDLLDSTENLMVSSVIHKAIINVNEDGTEAAAATKVLMAPGCAYPRNKMFHFIADHPFIFFLKDSRNIIYFSGHVYNLK